MAAREQRLKTMSMTNLLNFPQGAYITMMFLGQIEKESAQTLRTASSISMTKYARTSYKSMRESYDFYHSPTGLLVYVLSPNLAQGI